jgi:hypothetical protein
MFTTHSRTFTSSAQYAGPLAGVVAQPVHLQREGNMLIVSPFAKANCVDGTFTDRAPVSPRRTGAGPNPAG